MEAISTLPAGLAERFGYLRWGMITPTTVRPAPPGRRRPERNLRPRPGVAEIFEQALQCQQAGRTQHAIMLYGNVLALCPGHADAHTNLGVALAGLGRMEDAARCYERALALEPGSAHIHCNLANLLAVQGRTEEAIARFRQALSLRGDDAEALNSLGSLLAAQGEGERAAVEYRRAIEVCPTHAGAHNNLGNVLRDEGRLGEAMAEYDRAIALQPTHAEAHYNRSEIRTFHKGDADLVTLEALTRHNDLKPEQKTLLHFAAAKAREDSGDYKGAFEEMRLGNLEKRNRIRYEEAATARHFERIAEVFDRALLDRLQGSGDPSASPVFVLGMPRSGSTLVEQILASHPNVYGAGEREILNRIAGGGFPESVGSLNSRALRGMGEAYLSSLPPAARSRGRIVDKLPGNFLRIGLIRLILPNARIIHTVRNPLDTCISCYSRLFTSGQNFSYELGELGRYYRRYEELMAHWRSVIPTGEIHEVAYEDVVDDLEGQAKRLIEHCGLPWDPACISFHRNSRTVRTASAVQVRKPLFRSSLERWRRFEAWIGPLREALEGTAARAA